MFSKYAFHSRTAFVLWYIKSVSIDCFLFQAQMHIFTVSLCIPHALFFYKLVFLRWRFRQCFFHVEFKAVHGARIERERFSTSVPIPYSIVLCYIQILNSFSFDVTDWIIHRWERRTFLQLGDPLQQWVEGVLGALAVCGRLVVQLALFVLEFGHSGQQLALQVTQTPLQQVSQLAGK